MSRRTVVLTVALILAVVAAVAVWRYLASVEDQVRGDLDEVLVYKATSLIADGTAGTEAISAIDTVPGPGPGRGVRGLDDRVRRPGRPGDGVGPDGVRRQPERHRRSC